MLYPIELRALAGIIAKNRDAARSLRGFVTFLSPVQGHAAFVPISNSAPTFDLTEKYSWQHARRVDQVAAQALVESLFRLVARA